MKDNFSRVYIRTSFEIPNEDDFDSLGLAIRYDDAFIAYINGKEVLRAGIEFGRGAGAKGITKHEPEVSKDKHLLFDYFSLAHAKNLLDHTKPNIIAIEGHNVGIDSSDFTLESTLILNRDKSQKMPEKYTELIIQNSEWRYIAEKDADPGDDWSTPDFNATEWDKGESGFGYGKNSDASTALDDMKENYKVVYARKAFDVDDLRVAPKIGLAIRYDDGFVAYLNGEEILRRGVEEAKDGKDPKVEHREDISKDFEFFPLGNLKEKFVDGENVIAIEGHNATIGSSDFVLDAFLVTKD